MSQPIASGEPNSAKADDQQTVVTERGSCPLCECEVTANPGLYVHLQTSHRKSALARLVLDTDR